MSEKVFVYTATQGIAEVQAGRLSATAWMEACLDRIDAVEKTVKAWAFLDRALALGTARVIDEKRAQGLSIGPLYGAPLGVKDIFNTIQMPTRRGSAIYEDYKANNDARVVATLRFAHTAVVGKTTTDEFAVHWPSHTTNPHNPEHTPGGSSSGSAASVASGMVPLAIGSQTLGSTIRPSSYCGIYGFKPTFGLFPRTGMLKTTDTLDSVCLMSRSIADMRLIFETGRLRGMDYPLIQEHIDLKPLPDPSHRQWRVALLLPPSWVQEEGYATQALATFAAGIAKSGMSVNEVRLPAIFEGAPDIHNTIYNVSLAYYFKQEFGQHREKISEWFKEMVQKGEQIPNAQFQEALDKQNRMTRELQELLLPYDVVITLSSVGSAPKGLYTRNKADTCMIWTMCRGPVINVPVFCGPGGLPFGAQVAAKRYDDVSLLDFVSEICRRGLAPAAVSPVP